MAETVKKAVKTLKVDEKAAKDAAKATLHALAKPVSQKSVVAAVKPPSEVAANFPQAQAPKVMAPVKTEPQVKAEAPLAKTVKEPMKANTPEAQPEAPKAETQPEARKEADPGKEFVDSIMTEMALKGASKKRLIQKLAEQFNFDKQKVLFRLKRALITERYAAAHAEAGH